MSRRDPLDRDLWANPACAAVVGAGVTEYDVADFGMTAIRILGLFPRDLARLERMGPGPERHREVGLLLRGDPSAAAAIQGELRRARRAFAEANGLDPASRVSAVRRDALFVVGPPCRELSCGGYLFRAKNRYTSSARAGRLEFLHDSRGAGRTDVKGFSSTDREFHGPGLIRDVGLALGAAEGGSAFRACRAWRESYLSMRMPADRYREAAGSGAWRLRSAAFPGGVLASSVSPGELALVDPSWNYLLVILPAVQLLA